MMFKMFFHYKKYKITKLKGAIVTPLKFQLSVNSNLRLLNYCFTILCDWSRKLIPSCQPVTGRYKANTKFITSFYMFLAR